MGEMAIPLLKTKLYTPSLRPEIVSRPRLIERLNAGLHHRLTLVSAPAGFGKTTLLSEWAAQCQRTVAWVSLDGSDNDPAHFWAYVVAALHTVHIDVDDIGQAMFQSPRLPPVESMLTSLINQLAASPLPFALVLDDYHTIDAQPVHEGVTFLLDHLPPQVHLVVAGRSDPPLRLSRLRGRGQLAELRTADLRFTFEEAATFLNQVMGLGLSAEDVAALETRTEGWIVGLQMAALSMQGRDAGRVAGFIAALTGSHRYILDYLTDEVLLQQPASVQSFLLRTAILDRLSGSLCDAVTGQDSGQEMLKQLDAANLFIVPLDDERRWYRYHRLFADLLRKRLRRTQPDLLPTLHRQASEWYEQNGLIAEAVSHALAAGDVDRVARLVEGRALDMIFLGELTTLVGLLDALPDEVVSSRPWLCIAHAWVLVFAGLLDAVELWLKSAETTLATFDDARRAEGPVLRPQSLGLRTRGTAEGRHIAGHIAAIRAYVAALRGDMSCAAELTREALEQLPEEDLAARGLSVGLLGSVLRWSGDLVAAAQALARAIALAQAAGDGHTAAEALCSLAAVQLAQGQLHKTVATCRDALLLADEHVKRGGRRLPIAASGYNLMSQVLREWNDLDGALRHAREGIELCEEWGWPEGLALGCQRLARALQAIGDADGAHEAIQKARQAASGLSPWFGALMAAHQAWLWLAQGDLAAASRWLASRESESSVGKELSFRDVSEYVVLARVLIAQGRLDEALGLLARLLEMAEVAGAILVAIEILALQAMAWQARGEVDQALTALQRALTLAEPEGYVRTFIDEGAPMGELLQQVKAQGIAASYADKLLTELERETKDERRMTEPPLSSSVLRPSSPVLSEAEGLVEPLSERELDVLRLLAAGLSNREIAQQLYLSVNTVKTHIRSIYGKLGVHSRMQAVNRARELGLV